jgi:hypothetical protein
VVVAFIIFVLAFSTLVSDRIVALNAQDGFNASLPAFCEELVRAAQSTVIGLCAGVLSQCLFDIGRESVGAIDPIEGTMWWSCT